MLLKTLEARLTDTTLYQAQNKDTLKELLNRRTELTEELEAETGWLNALEALEQAEKHFEDNG